MTQTEWDRRIRRANELISSCPFAAEGLRFYGQVAAFQRGLYVESQHTLKSLSTKFEPIRRPDNLDLFFLLPKFSAFLSLVQRISPPPLALAARDLAAKGRTEWQRVMEEFWSCELTAGAGTREVARGAIFGMTRPEHVLVWIFLQPYAEYLASHSQSLRVDGAPFTCPVCGGNPIVGVLRPEGDGAKKSLVCMLCAHEWAFRRIYCPACGEEREPQMAFYVAPEIAHVRVDVCDTCKTYLKSIDLTKTGLAVPIVDELATIPLDLWAREHGYEKLQTNLLGT
jgi:hypothetical protein